MLFCKQERGKKTIKVLTLGGRQGEKKNRVKYGILVKSKLPSGKEKKKGAP